LQYLVLLFGACASSARNMYELDWERRRSKDACATLVKACRGGGPHFLRNDHRGSDQTSFLSEEVLKSSYGTPCIVAKMQCRPSAVVEHAAF
jgi:hypothetical protein